ncbi:hypothetical protein OQA88_9897 [Cercophora sp. LCS_1]
MASIFHAAVRLAKGRRHPAARTDEEQPQPPPSVMVPSTYGGYTLPAQSQFNGTAPLSTTEDPLTLFRLMIGITRSPDLGYESPTRPAENIGLYARVVHSEQTAKDSYKVFSVLINACYFLQIVIAAALTALGAANADNKAITAFGAFNTIIAGFLTYLKGSGLPGRLKYFGNEWKKIREFIEQRERDFSHENCTLDVYEVVETIRGMYADTKRDIELNTPDSYNSMTNHAKAMGGGGVDPKKAEEVAGKLRSLDETVRKLKSKVETTVSDVKEGAHGIHNEGKRTIQELRDLEKSAKGGIELKGDLEIRAVVDEKGRGS